MPQTNDVKRPSRGRALGGGLVAALVLLSIVLVLPLLDSTRWPFTHDNSFRYFWVLDHFRDALHHGILYPRWLPDAYGGYGSPMFVFYQPAFYFVAALFAELVDNPLHAMWVTLWFLLAQGGVGAYCLARRFGGPLGSFLCALLFLLTPYLYTNLHVRGDLSEFAGVLLTPWPLVGLLAMARRGGARPWRWFTALLGTAVALALVPAAHPAIGMFYFPCFALLALALVPSSPCPRAFSGSVIAALLIACALCAPYWANFMHMRQYVVFDSLHTGYFKASDHVVYPHQLISNFWGYAASESGTADGMPFQLGLVHALTALVGFVVAGPSALLRAALALYALLILCMLPVAAPLWDRLSFISMIQFPWRILGVVAILQLLLITGMLQRRKPGLLIILVVANLLAGLWTPDQFAPNPLGANDAVGELRDHRNSYLDAFHSYSEPTDDAVLARTARNLRAAGPRGSTPLVTVEADRSCQPLADHSRHFIHYVVGPGPASLLSIQQVYLPGWTVELNGETVSRAQLEADLSEHGTLRIPIPEGRVEIAAHYAGPPLSPWVNGLAALGTLSVLLLWHLFIGRHLDHQGTATELLR